MTNQKTQNILLDMLTFQGKISQAKKENILRKHPNILSSDKKGWDNILRREKIVSDIDIAKAYAQIFNFPFIYLAGQVVPFQALQSIPEKLSRQYQIFPYKIEGGTIKIAIADPAKLKSRLEPALKKIEREKGIKLELAITPFDDWQKAMNVYGKLKEINKNEEKSLPKEKVDEQAKDKEKITNVSKIPREILEHFPYNIARQYKMLVSARPSADKIKVMAVNPSDQATVNILNFIKKKNNLEIEVEKVSEETLENFLRGYEEYKEENKKMPDVSENNVPDIKSVSAIEQDKKDKPNFKLENNQEQEKRGEERISEGVPEVVSSELPAALRKELEGVAFNIKEAQKEELEERDLFKFLGKEISSLGELKNAVRSGQITKIVASTISFAVFRRASDIHIEAQENAVKLRFRIDGILEDVLRLPSEMHSPIISRIKILSNLKIDEKRIPQDGRFKVKSKDKEIDLRISTLPTTHGEKVVMRLLDKSRGLFTLEELGIVGQQYHLLVKSIERPYGIVLVTGPTGSGKTTTLYAILNRLSTPEINIVTLEDPVEYEIEGVNQCQIKPQIGFGFAEGLRSILRQDPNMIMVGEIRDHETASMATHAALTGHLVLTTLHTNNASSALPRLINMGVEPFLITSSINAVIAQRLVRRLCSICRKEDNPPKEIEETVKHELSLLKPEQKKEIFGNLDIKLKFYTAQGCNDCNQGYSGRIGIYEVLSIDEEIEELFASNASSSAISAKAIKNGMITMRQDGYIKAIKGITSLDEIMRATSEEEGTNVNELLENKLKN